MFVNYITKVNYCFHHYFKQDFYLWHNRRKSIKKEKSIPLINLNTLGILSQVLTKKDMTLLDKRQVT